MNEGAIKWHMSHKVFFQRRSRKSSLSFVLCNDNWTRNNRFSKVVVVDAHLGWGAVRMTKTVLKPLKTISSDGQLQQLLVREANPKKPQPDLILY